ncbi:unnamed protein product [Spirodela intermedia]|uniref:Uncharacterized protein n=1 Tax=Spirodela intermedia TaxID=51605 RepID=A0A7I8KSF2_SPIIN|nr:unnamed protein product [Spirodela intermedia]
MSVSSKLLHFYKFLLDIMGYFSGSPPQIMSVAIAAISLLIYKDADLYFLVPDLMPTVLFLLQSKANEVIKVRSILEIVIRKCSIDLVLLHVPDEYKGFIKMITEWKYWFVELAQVM